MISIPWIFMGTFQNKDFDLLLNNVQIGVLQEFVWVKLDFKEI